MTTPADMTSRTKGELSSGTCEKEEQLAKGKSLNTPIFLFLLFSPTVINNNNNDDDNNYNNNNNNNNNNNINGSYYAFCGASMRLQI